MEPYEYSTQYLASLLDDLASIEQSPRYHPEGNALFHSLQVYRLAKHASDAPELHAAALFHDVGKAVSDRDHPRLGREMLQGILSPRIQWLVEHHLHLLIHPQRTRRRLHGTRQLEELELLRSWDLGGRRPRCDVPSPQRAISDLTDHWHRITCQDCDPGYMISIPL